MTLVQCAGKAWVDRTQQQTLQNYQGWILPPPLPPRHPLHPPQRPSRQVRRAMRTPRITRRKNMCHPMELFLALRLLYFRAVTSILSLPKGRNLSASRQEHSRWFTDKWYMRPMYFCPSCCSHLHQDSEQRKGGDLECNFSQGGCGEAWKLQEARCAWITSKKKRK